MKINLIFKMFYYWKTLTYANTTQYSIIKNIFQYFIQFKYTIKTKYYKIIIIYFQMFDYMDNIQNNNFVKHLFKKF